MLIVRCRFVEMMQVVKAMKVEVHEVVVVVVFW